MGDTRNCMCPFYHAITATDFKLYCNGRKSPRQDGFFVF